METITNKWLHKFKKSIEPGAIRGNRRVVVFSVCLFIASVLWFLNALSKNYTTYIDYPVRYSELPKNKFIINEPPKKLQIRVNAHGFTLLRYKLRLAFTPAVLSLSDIITENRLPGGGTVNIPASSVIEKMTGQVSSDMQILDVRPSTLQLILDSLESRQIPVASRIIIHYSGRFAQSGSTEIIPATVEVSGSRAVIGDTDTIFTDARIYKNIDSNLEKEISLDIPEHLTVIPKKVVVRVPVDEYTEKSFSVPIYVDALPEGTRIRLFPQQAEVNFSIGLKKFPEINPENFPAFIKWEDIEKGITNLPIYTGEIPEGLKSLKINPQHVEYLIERNE
jgi:hypothetical protein